MGGWVGGWPSIPIGDGMWGLARGTKYKIDNVVMTYLTLLLITYLHSISGRSRPCVLSEIVLVTAIDEQRTTIMMTAVRMRMQHGGDCILDGAD